MVSGHQACTFEIGMDIFQQNTKVQSARRSVQLLVSFPNCHFRNLSGYFVNRFEIGHGFVPKYRFQICTLAVLDRFEICHFWSNTPLQIADLSPPDCLIFLQQIPDL